MERGERGKVFLRPLTIFWIFSAPGSNYGRAPGSNYGRPRTIFWPLAQIMDGRANFYGRPHRDVDVTDDQPHDSKVATQQHSNSKYKVYISYVFINYTLYLIMLFFLFIVPVIDQKLGTFLEAWCFSSLQFLLSFMFILPLHSLFHLHLLILSFRLEKKVNWRKVNWRKRWTWSSCSMCRASSLVTGCQGSGQGASSFRIIRPWWWWALQVLRFRTGTSSSLAACWGLSGSATSDLPLSWGLTLVALHTKSFEYVLGSLRSLDRRAQARIRPVVLRSGCMYPVVVCHQHDRWASAAPVGGVWVNSRDDTGPSLAAESSSGTLPRPIVVASWRHGFFACQAIILINLRAVSSFASLLETWPSRGRAPSFWSQVHRRQARHRIADTLRHPLPPLRVNTWTEALRVDRWARQPVGQPPLFGIQRGDRSVEELLTLLVPHRGLELPFYCL